VMARASFGAEKKKGSTDFLFVMGHSSKGSTSEWGKKKVDVVRLRYENSGKNDRLEKKRGASNDMPF